MTPEQLLLPRIKVIEDYPNSTFDVGQVLQLAKDRYSFYYYEWAEHDGLHREYLPFFEEYPHIFKKLGWWEERLITEMPDHVKLVSEHKYVFKIFSYIEDGKIRVHNDNGGKSIVRLSEFLPATKEEYDLQKTQQNH